MKVPVISGSLDHITDDAVRASAVKLIPPGSVLIVTRSGILAHTLPVARTAVAVTVNQDIKALTPTPPFDPDFIAWGARAFGWSILNACSKDGTTVANVDTTLLQDFRLPIAPEAEQHRIVSAIESYFTRLDDAVATLERVQRNLKRYRASVLKAAVEGRLVPTEAELARAEGRSYEPASVLLTRILAERRRRWEEAELAKMAATGKTPKDDKWKAKYVEPVAPDTSELPELPEGWCWASLPQLGEINRGTSKHRPRNDPRLLGGPYPFIQTGDVRHSGGFITKHSSTYSEFGLAQSRSWPSGTLCITIAANIAETGILKFDACFPDSVVGFLSEAEPTQVRFIELFLRTAKQELERYAPATAQKNINLEVLAAVAVPLPPREEQARIVREVDRLLSVGSYGDASAQQNALRCTRLRQSILKWAFAGRLVDQDPTDEPASVLLERIRAERAAAPTQQPRREPRRRRVTSR
jgi:type I restriction enzyme S subunit